MGAPTDSEKAVSPAPADQGAAAKAAAAATTNDKADPVKAPAEDEKAAVTTSSTPTDAEAAAKGAAAAPASAMAATDNFAGKIDELGSEFITGQEWGLFGPPNSDPDRLKATIIEQLGKAQTAVADKNLVAQQTAYLEAKDAFSIAQRRRPFWYLANTRFGFLPLVYTGLSSAFTYNLVFRHLAPSTFDQALHNAAFWGLAGAILKALYWLQFQINKGLLRPRWLAYFLVAPVIGILLGAISSLIVKVGFKLLKSGSDVETDWRVIALFAAFAGFNWEWALEKFKYSADAVWSRIGDKKGNGTSKGT